MKLVQKGENRNGLFWYINVSMGISDMVKLMYPQPQFVTIVIYCVFFAAWAVFGICLKKAQKKFLHI